MAFKDFDFTIHLISDNPHRKGTDNWRAGQIIEAMEGCYVPSIVKALRTFEENRTVGVADPAGWLNHFAGFGSGPRDIKPWIEIIYKGKKLETTSEYRALLKDHAHANSV